MAFSPRARQTCYDSYYPFGLFEGRTLPELDFLEITILYGGNGSGKTTFIKCNGRCPAALPPRRV